MKKVRIFFILATLLCSLGLWRFRTNERLGSEEFSAPKFDSKRRTADWGLRAIAREPSISEARPDIRDSEIKTVIKTAQSLSPTYKVIRALGKEEVHLTPKPLLQFVDSFGPIQKLAAQSGENKALAIEFFTACVRNEELIPTAREICLAELGPSERDALKSEVPRKIWDNVEELISFRGKT